MTVLPAKSAMVEVAMIPRPSTTPTMAPSTVMAHPLISVAASSPHSAMFAVSGASGLVDPVLWVSRRFGRLRSTSLEPLSERVASAGAEEVLITIMCRPSAGASYEVSGSQRFVRAPFSDHAVPVSPDRAARVVRLQASPLVISAHGPVTITPPGTHIVVPLRSQAAQDQQGLVQRFAACPDGTSLTPLCYGHPFLKRVWFAGARPVASGLWSRYVARAVALTGNAEMPSSLSPGELDMLLAVSLQGCTGVYCKERADDRGPVDIKFGENSDCDDEAVSVCALVLALLAEPPRASDDPVLCHLRAHYVSAAVVCGLARSPTAPTKEPFGHSWAVVLRRPNDVAGGLHVEPTAPMTPTPRTWDKARWPLVLPSDAYTARSAVCLERMKEQELKGNRVVGVRQVEARFYGAPVTVMTPDRQFIWPTGTAAWHAVISGAVVSPPAEPRPGRDPDELHHLPDRTRQLPPGYSRVDPAVPFRAPPTWLGMVALPLVGADGVQVDPFSRVAFV